MNNVLVMKNKTTSMASIRATVAVAATAMGMTRKRKK